MTTENQDAPEVVEKTAEQIAADDAAEQAAANAAFAKTATGDEPSAGAKTDDAPVKTAEEIEAENKAAEEARQQQVYEEWLQGVPPSVRESLAAIPSLQTRVRGVEGHIGGLTSQTKALREAMTAAKTAATNAGADAPTDEQVKAAVGNLQKWNQVKEDFPEWFEAMEERLSIVHGKPSAPINLDEVRSKLRTEVKAEVKAEVIDEVQIELLDTARPGWGETLNKPEFRDFVLAGGPSAEDYAAMKALEETNPAKAKEIQDGYAQTHPDWWKDKGQYFFSSKAKDAIKLLDGFTAATNKHQAPVDAPVKQDNRARLAAAVAPTRATSAPVKRETQTEEEAAAASFKRIRSG